MTESVVMEVEDGVLTATLNEPATMNALSPAISQGIFDALERANQDEAVRVLVLTGSGRGFCAGAAVGGVGGGGQAPSRRARLDQQGSSARTMQAFSSCEVPVIAAVNGVAVGAGFGIALCCDVRILAESARMGSIFIKRGLASDYGVAYWLPRIIGMGRACDLMYSGNILDSAACLSLGLANRVVQDDALLAEAKAYARMIADGPPLAYTLVRRMLQRGGDMPLGDFAEYEWSNQRLLLGSKDVAEGFRSFIEKRPARFTGE
ncbi:MAG TPA: enoyl-CoA hydratase-related protein [Pseudomonadales bacterium]